jgi:tRNA pseudouridine13 synthase
LDTIEKSIEHTKNTGFINYYGMQRFGTGTVASHEVGIAVLQSDWKKAVELILSPENRNDTREALANFRNTQDAKKAMEQLPVHSIEHKVIRSLNRNGLTAYYNGFSALPRNLRLMYVHAVQSYVWNEIVSIRIQKFGITPQVGDLILIAEEPVAQSEEVDQVSICFKFE